MKDEISKKVLKKRLRTCRSVVRRAISWFRGWRYFQPSRPGESTRLESYDRYFLSPDSYGLDSLPAACERDWQEKIEDKVKRAKELIRENEMNMKVFYLKKQINVIHDTNTDSAN